MTRRADIVNALRESPTAFADRLGFPLLTDLHRDWCREMVFGKSDHTLQAHRSSYKTRLKDREDAAIAAIKDGHYLGGPD